MGRNPVDKPQSKNKSSAVFIVGVFAAVVILMFIARMRGQDVPKISIPLNNGIVSLLTYDNLLAAISNDNKIYVLQWSDLSKKPREGVVESGEVVFVAPDTIVSVKRTNPDCLVVSGFDANSVSRKIPLSLTSNVAHLNASRDGSRIILLLEHGGKDVTYELLEVLLNTGQVRPIAAIPSEQSKLGHFSVSDDGRYVVAAGERNEHGWLFVVDTKEKKIVWQKEFPDFRKLYKGVFSNDGEVIYVRGSDSMLTLVKTSSGEIIDRWLPTKENKDTYRAQQTQTVVISKDGGLVAAVVGGGIFAWDTKTREKYDIIGVGHKVMSSIVFSPDAKFIATSDMRQGGDIKIIRTPRH
jgi:WD40 repeat protein